VTGAKPSFGIFLLGINADSLGPLIAVAAAVVAAQAAKYITKESRSLRFMESAMAGVIQYFIWFLLFIALLYLVSGWGETHRRRRASRSTSRSRSQVWPFIDIVSFVPRISSIRRSTSACVSSRRHRARRGPQRARSNGRAEVDRRQDGRCAGTQSAGERHDPMSGAFNDVRSLYLHIPFCERKCEYCDFTSVAGATGSAAYMDALNAEVRHLGERLGRLSLDTVFIGGGTPSLVEPELLAGLVATVRDTFSVAAGAEVTMERTHRASPPPGRGSGGRRA